MMSRRKISLLIGTLVILLACGYGSAAAQGTIVLQTQFPVQKEKTRILVQAQNGDPVAGARVSATYRPGSRVEEESEVGTTDAGGSVEWIPKEAGIVSISAAFSGADGNDLQLQTNVSVKFASTPMSGVLIMLLAGTLLIGGSIVRFVKYMRGQEF
jgi:hypothetical protein